MKHIHKRMCMSNECPISRPFSTGKSYTGQSDWYTSVECGQSHLEITFIIIYRNMWGIVTRKHHDIRFHSSSACWNPSTRIPKCDDMFLSNSHILLLRHWKIEPYFLPGCTLHKIHSYTDILFNIKSWLHFRNSWKSSRFMLWARWWVM